MSGGAKAVVALTIIGALGVTGAIVATRTAEVRTGKIVTCKHCDQKIENTVRSMRVPWWKAGDYRVARTSRYCDGCGNQTISYKVHLRCERCKKTYSTHSEQALRKEGTSDKTRTDGYCTSRCRKLARVEGVIDKTSEGVGDVMGRIGKGLSRGIRKHGE